MHVHVRTSFQRRMPANLDSFAQPVQWDDVVKHYDCLVDVAAFDTCTPTLTSAPGDRLVCARLIGFIQGCAFTGWPLMYNCQRHC
jgi:hypothetical protein